MDFEKEMGLKNSMYMESEVTRELEKFAYKVEKEISNTDRKKTTFEIDYDKFLDSEEYKKLLEKYDKKELLECIILSEPLAIANKRFMLSGTERKVPTSQKNK